MEAESRIATVTLYARGARIRRVATLGAAAPRVRLIGLPAALIDRTVRIEAEGGAVVTAVRVGLDAPAPEIAADEESPELHAARLRVALADAETERIAGALAILAAAPIALSGAPGAGEAPPSAEPPAWSAVVDARRALVALRAERELALRDQATAARRAAEQARRGLAAALDRDRRAGSGRPAKLHELRKHVELELDLEGRGRDDEALATVIYLEYQIAAARWSPSYVARFDGDQVGFALRAMVAQNSGEDWAGVALQLSTADPEQFGALPELSAQRIGRRQAEPSRAGFRAPPAGAAALYLDYVQAFPDSEPTRRIVGSRVAEAITGESMMSVMPVARESRELERDEPGDPDDASDALEELTAPTRFGAAAAEPRALGGHRPLGRAQAAAPPPGAGAPSPAPRASAMMIRGAQVARSVAGGPITGQALRQAVASAAGNATARATASADDGERAGLASPFAPPAVPSPRLDYADLRMAPPGSSERGRLVAAPPDRRTAALEAEVALAVARVAGLVLPPGCTAGWPHTYDYAFAADGAIDLRSDGAWHSIAVTAHAATAAMRHIAVPREQADVFRIAAIANPLPGPILPGPIDVYDRGNFVVTSALEHTPAGAAIEIGLGVDPRIKLARNTEFHEETTGVLRGGLRLHHAIQIDVENLSDRAIDLEVRERVPVTRDGDDDIEVAIGRVEPAWQRFTPDAAAPGAARLRGGYCWRVAVPAGTKRALRATYEVRIAGKHELVGGNRRES
jgi:hypothetical protein